MVISPSDVPVFVRKCLLVPAMAACTALAGAGLASPASAQHVKCLIPEKNKTYEPPGDECRMGEQTILPDFSNVKRDPPKPPPAKAAAKPGAKATAKVAAPPPPPEPPPPPPPPRVAFFSGAAPVNVKQTFADKSYRHDEWTLVVDPDRHVVSTRVEHYSGTEEVGIDFFEADLAQIGASLAQPISPDGGQFQEGKYYGAYYVNLICQDPAPCVREKYTLNGQVKDGGATRAGIRLAFKNEGEAKSFVAANFPMP